ncbi:MAG: hypothetical protein ABI162_08730 [Luteolibacter sp.]
METPPITRIQLGEKASQALTDAGGKCFAIVTRATHPNDPSRWVIHLVPIDWQTATDADAVLHGRATAKRMKQPKPSPTPP